MKKENIILHSIIEIFKQTNDKKLAAFDYLHMMNSKKSKLKMGFLKSRKEKLL